jgi:inner membrane protein
MDSLTQIILGAACGEIALGKKIGNKALLFGAIGGTIPDLDVFIGKILYSNEIQALAFHRGFMHSLLFAVLAAVFFGWCTFMLYNTGDRKDSTTYKSWIWLFFLSIFTHPILDCFTPYGTQIFAPFSNYRVAFNSISVVDPLYTLPFLFCMVTVLCYNRTNIKRQKWTKLGIYLSCIYLLFTLANKIYIDSVFRNSFKKAKISIQRFSAQPSIFNNILWYAVAETNTQYHLAFYSLLDTSPTANKIISIDKSNNLIDMRAKNLRILAWFSNEYYHISKKEETDSYQYIDLRYPMLNPENIDSSIFNFTLIFKNKQWDMLPFQGSPPDREDFISFLGRLKGI